MPIDPLEPSAGNATGFYLTIATADSDALQIRLTERDTNQRHVFERFDEPPAAIWNSKGLTLETLSASARTCLRNGKGVYWVEPGPIGTLAYRMGIVIPDSIDTAFGKLETFTSVAADSTPLGADHIDLAAGFFYMVVLGDSVAWGNGLPEESKYPSLVATAIEAETGLTVIQQIQAISGAKIVPDENDGICGLNCYRGAPPVSTSVTLQVDCVSHPELTDLVLMNGCINDIGVVTVLDPATDPNELADLSNTFCRDEMILLLEKVHDTMPQAPIVVTGYYPIVSLQSELEGLMTWMGTQDMTMEEGLLTLLEPSAANSQVFHETSSMYLAEAVQTVNATLPDELIAFADPGFTGEHSVFTSQAWLWGLRKATGSSLAEELGIELLPEDPQLSRRAEACLEQIGTGSTIECLYTSIGHPNLTGAQIYRDASVDALQRLGVLATNP